MQTAVEQQLAKEHDEHDAAAQTAAQEAVEVNLAAPDGVDVTSATPESAKPVAQTDSLTTTPKTSAKAAVEYGGHVAAKAGAEQRVDAQHLEIALDQKGIM